VTPSRPPSPTGSCPARAAGGLAAQPLPHRLGRGPARLRPGRTIGQHQRRCPELGTTWPSLRKAFQRYGLGIPARKPRPSATAPSPPPVGAGKPAAPPQPGNDLRLEY
jgi:hypothetical protein